MGEILKMLGAIAALGIIPGLIVTLSVKGGPVTNKAPSQQEEKAKRCAPFNVLYQSLIKDGVLVDRDNDVKADIYIKPFYWGPLNIESREGLAKNLFNCQDKMRIRDYSNGKALAEWHLLGGWDFQ